MFFVYVMTNRVYGTLYGYKPFHSGLSPRQPVDSAPQAAIHV